MCNFLKNCRCCLADDVPLFDMLANKFTVESESLDFMNAYNAVSGAPAITTSPQNQKICEMCSVLLVNAYSFQLMCQQSNESYEKSEDQVHCYCCLTSHLDQEMLCMIENLIDNHSVDILDGYVDCTDVIVDLTDLTRFKICKKCKFQLDNAYSFRKMCQKADEKLKQQNRGAAVDEKDSDCIVCEDAEENKSCMDSTKESVNDPDESTGGQSSKYQHKRKLIPTQSADDKQMEKIPTKIKKKMKNRKIAFKCNLCDGEIIVIDKKYIWDHVWINHRKNMPFNCNFCTYRTQRKDRLKSHLLRLHNEQFDESIDGYHKETIQQVRDSAGIILE